MKNRYSYSVIIPTFKNHKKIIRAIDSLQKQTVDNFELVVVNNNHEDGLISIIETYNETAKIKVNYYNYPYDGVYGARNAAIKYSTGDIIICIDDDETCVENFISAYMKLFEKHDNVFAAGGPYKVVFEDNPPDWVKNYIKNKRIDYVWGHYDPYDDLVIKEAVNLWGGNMALRREVFSWTGWYPGKNDGKSTGPGESGLVKDIADKKGCLMAFIPEAIIYHHIAPERTTIKHLRWSASYLMNIRFYNRYRKRKISIINIIVDYFKTCKEYYKLWIKDFFYSRFRRDVKSLDVQYLASMGYWKMKYLTWILFNSKVRKFVKKTDYTSVNYELKK